MLQLAWNLGDFPFAQHYWLKMKELGISPDSNSFMYLIHTAAKCLSLFLFPFSSASLATN